MHVKARYIPYLLCLMSLISMRVYAASDESQEDDLTKPWDLSRVSPLLHQTFSAIQNYHFDIIKMIEEAISTKHTLANSLRWEMFNQLQQPLGRFLAVFEARPDIYEAFELYQNRLAFYLDHLEQSGFEKTLEFLKLTSFMVYLIEEYNREKEVILKRGIESVPIKSIIELFLKEFEIIFIKHFYLNRLLEKESAQTTLMTKEDWKKIKEGD